jgi:hypothetical protein
MTLKTEVKHYVIHDPRAYSHIVRNENGRWEVFVGAISLLIVTPDFLNDPTVSVRGKLVAVDHYRFHVVGYSGRYFVMEKIQR